MEYGKEISLEEMRHASLEGMLPGTDFNLHTANIRFMGELYGAWIVIDKENDNLIKGKTEGKEITAYLYNVEDGTPKAVRDYARDRSKNVARPLIFLTQGEFRPVLSEKSQQEIQGYNSR